MTRKSKKVIGNDQNQRLDGSGIFLQSLPHPYLCLLLQIRTLPKAAHQLPEASESAFSHLHHHQKVSPYPHVHRSRAILCLVRLSCCADPLFWGEWRCTSVEQPDTSLWAVSYISDVVCGVVSSSSSGECWHWKKWKAC